ncbi:response regulator transcription factor [Sediminibacterium soli]|uniref:response regulator transcription factor n=1 Tax=Sediminibacterium soli TaxID=2698829 RepID=UPI00137A0E38|nr:response regulator transcription factor [Sediminibacterium soli]NCI47190.1 response regulator transcription factor [Sediminibacterium soli]
MKILLADDEPILLKTIELKLQKEGYQVVSTCDGREAVAKIDEYDPDIVITDLMMPYISGLEIVAFVRKKTHKKIGVIMLTAMEQEKVVMEAFELGVDDYVTKPFSLNELVIRVKKLAMQFARNNAS